VTHPGGLPDDRAQILDSADRYARERLAPLAERMDAEEWWPDDAFRALGKKGFLGVTTRRALRRRARSLSPAVSSRSRFRGWRTRTKP